VKNYLKLSIFVSIYMLCILSVAYAETEVSEGYDENTEVTVKGTLKELQRGMRGPIIMILNSGSKTYKVITAPPWFLEQEGVEFTTGIDYEVTGSKYIARDGNIYISASRLKNIATGKISILRDSSCMPRWRGRMMRRGMN
jgi:hypothetical protein